MAQTEKNNNTPNPNKWEKTAEIGSLVLGAVLTSLQIYFTIRENRQR